MSNSSTNEVRTLVATMIKVFRKKKRLKTIINGRVARGRARASANDFEEELSKYFASKISSVRLLVDFPVSFRPENGGRKYTIYPDITIVKDSKILSIIEAKIDLGYLREDWVNRRKETLDLLKRSKEITVKGEKYYIHKKIIFANIVLSESNDHGRFPAFVNNSKNTLVLIDKLNPHPNEESIQDYKKYLDDVSENKNNQKNWFSLENLSLKISELANKT